MIGIFNKSRNSGINTVLAGSGGSNNSNTNNTSQKILIFIMCMCLVFVITAFTIKAISGTSHEICEDLCQCRNDPKFATAIILDLTDGLLDYQIAAFKEEIRYRVREMPTNSKLLLYVIEQPPNGESAQIVKLFSKCKPRDGSDAKGITDNARMLKNQYNIEFEDALHKVIDEINFVQTSDNSPILGTLYKISKDPSFFKADDKKIIIFSNMMENSQLISHYTIKQPNFEQTRKLLPRLLDIGNSLRDTNITIFLIPNKDNYSVHIKWWKEYFKYMNADMPMVKIM